MASGEVGAIFGAIGVCAKIRRMVSDRRWFYCSFAKLWGLQFWVLPVIIGSCTYFALMGDHGSTQLRQAKGRVRGRPREIGSSLSSTHKHCCSNLNI